MHIWQVAQFLGKKKTLLYISRGKAGSLFLGKLKEKLARKARVNTERVISDRANAPWVSYNTS